ncbi:M56 family metallopeptidase [Niabella sp.]|uniref:M56 family metallopeptidase n=1 Tax=Niabella sp. TaxID=1962976 RepID=UPI00262C79AB|nr:M56 family metallopeptidase [Niabella sp.]
MKTIVIYLLQLFLCSGILYGYYLLFLKNRRQHQFNRFFLLASLLLSILIPFIRVPYYISLTKDSGIGLQALVKYNALLLPEVTVAAGKSIFPWEPVLWAILLSGSVYFLLKLFLGVSRLLKLRRQCTVKKKDGITVIYTKDPRAPFSFFQWLFRNPEKEPSDAENILQHELCHIRQFHSLDVLIAEVITAVVWINPFYWILKAELSAVHEFAADDYAARQTDELEYATYLVNQAIVQKRHALINPFFNHQFKRRITMLTKKSTSKNSYNKWIAVPLFIATAIFFIISCQKKDVLPSSSALSKPDIEASYQGNWIHFLTTNLKGEVPVENGAGPGNYKVIMQFVVDVDGTVSDARLLQDPGYGMGAEALRVLQQSGKWKPAMADGKPVKAYRKQPITFQITEG